MNLLYRWYASPYPNCKRTYYIFTLFRHRVPALPSNATEYISYKRLHIPETLPWQAIQAFPELDAPRKRTAQNHLEVWTCRVDDCRHTSYRKDYKLQHIVQENQFPPTRQETKGTWELGIDSTVADGRTCRNVLEQGHF